MFHPFEYAGPVRIPPPTMQLRVRKETDGDDTINARQFEHWQTDVPIPQSRFILKSDGTTMEYSIKAGVKNAPASTDPTAVAYDMAPLTSRTDKRDYRQSQPFDVRGPSLAMNPYFDRYDPTRDPRNMIREMRAVVYEDKSPDRGLEESKRITARGYMTRWVPEGSSQEELVTALQSYDTMRPIMNDMSKSYRK